jgi:hypothetical protein
MNVMTIIIITTAVDAVQIAALIMMNVQKIVLQTLVANNVDTH